MFEREIKFIYDFNLNKVNRLGPYFTFEQLSSTDIHPAILNYISAEIDYLIFEDRQNLLKNSMFDYSGEKITNYFDGISEEIKKTKRFALEYISKIILHASSFTLNYLVRPKWTLLKFVFDEGDHKTTLEIKQILNYTYYYQYIRKILISYINSKKILSMNSAEFGELLEKVDKLGIESNLPNILSNAVKSMSDFFNIGEIQKNKIPLIAIETFLEEKQLNIHLQKVRDNFGEDKIQKINVFDLQKIIDSIINEKFETLPAEKSIEEEMIVEPIKPITPDSDKIIEEESLELNDEPELTQETFEKPTKLRIRIDEDFANEQCAEENIISEMELPLVEEMEEENILKKEEFIENDYSQKENEIVNLKNDLVENKIDDSVSDDENLEIGEPEEEEIELFENDEEELIESESKEFIDEEPYEKERIHIDQLEDEENESMLQSILQSSGESEEVNIAERKFILNEDEARPKMDIAELLEHKDMTKVIEVIFDYDIEEFANTLDEISACTSLDDAYVVLNQSLKNHNIGRNSKEAEAFRAIISHYFSR